MHEIVCIFSMENELMMRSICDVHRDLNLCIVHTAHTHLNTKYEVINIS